MKKSILFTKRIFARIRKLQCHHGEVSVFGSCNFEKKCIDILFVNALLSRFKLDIKRSRMHYFLEPYCTFQVFNSRYPEMPKVPGA